MGETTPSVTGVTVIGKPKRDYAVFVSIDKTSQDCWIDPDLLEFVDRNPGITMTLDGVPKKWTRNADGEWSESGVGFVGRIKQWLRKRK